MDAFLLAPETLPILAINVTYTLHQLLHIALRDFGFSQGDMHLEASFYSSKSGPPRIFSIRMSIWWLIYSHYEHAQGKYF